MNRLPTATIALLITNALLSAGTALAQARGPSASEIQKFGTPTKGPGERERVLPWVIAQAVADQYGIESDNMDPDMRYVPDKGLVLQKGAEQIVLNPPVDDVLDGAARAQQLAQQQVWLRRMMGRFRIDGVIKSAGSANTGAAVVPALLSGEVSGVADCDGIGEGAGVNCIFNATWPVIDLNVSRIGMAPSPSERLNIFRPAMMVLGFNPDTAEVRALLVTDDSLGHTMAGRLTEDALSARRQTACRVTYPFDPCVQVLRVVAEPESEMVTIVLGSGVTTIKLVMYRDPDARPEEPMKRQKVR